MLVAVQSYCLYSAVALIPAALALLVFQVCPMLYVLLSWAAGKERPRGLALLAMPLALVGLAAALDIRWDALAERWSQIGAGATWAFAGALSYSVVLYLNANRLKALDGRLRTLLMTGITALLAAVGCAGKPKAVFPPVDPPIVWPDPWPGNMLTAMRVATFAKQTGRAVSFSPRGRCARSRR